MMPEHRAPLLVLAGLALAGLALAGCEEHPRRIVQGQPEYLHDALLGDVAAQGRLADCLEATGKCLDTPADPAMACAWRGVRLASRSPVLTLDDAEVFRARCGAAAGSFGQRAALAREQFTRKLYGRGAPPPEALSTAGLLYPSAEALRQAVNIALGSGQARLPAFGPPQGAPGRLSWRSCSAAACLEASSPEFGGGVYSYRVTVAGDRPEARPLAARLAAAALQAPALADVVAAAPEGRPGLAAGGVCWTAGRVDGGGAFAAARLGPC